MRHRGQSTARYPLSEQETNVPGSTHVVDNLKRIESNTVSSLSLIPLVAFNDTNATTRGPFLHYFEDLDCFPLLILQLGTWVCFITFCIFFLGFEPFKSILRKDYDYGSESISLNTSSLSFYIFLIQPTWSCFFFLLCPRKELLPRPLIFNIIRFFVFSVCLLFPILNFVYFSKVVGWVRGGPVVFAFSILTYMGFAMLYTCFVKIPPPSYQLP